MSYKTTKIMITLLILLNLVDLTVTITAIENGWAEEANPLMDFFLQMGYAYFVVVKLTGVSFASFVFWKYRSRKLTSFCLSFALGVYICLNLHFLNAFL
jgi:hypothetical protein|tara:strand:- start:945 stop:1241 length:297 start_codon:yes stop_codon:yes gene_type:complete